MSILRLTFGGIPLLAIHKYAPIWSRFTFVKFNISPSTVSTIGISAVRTSESIPEKRH